MCYCTLFTLVYIYHLIAWAVFSVSGLAQMAGSFTKELSSFMFDWAATTATDIGQFVWDVLPLILYGMCFILQLIFYTVAFATAWYIGTLVYRFLT